MRRPSWPGAACAAARHGGSSSTPLRSRPARGASCSSTRWTATWWTTWWRTTPSRGTPPRPREPRAGRLAVVTMTPHQLIDALDEIYASIIDVGRDLTEEEWARPTDCAGWSVKDHVSHLVGM